MSIARSGGRAYYQRYFLPEQIAVITLDMRGWVWWQVIAICTQGTGGAADDVFLVSVVDSANNVLMSAGVSLKVAAGASHAMQMAINNPQYGTPALNVILQNTAEDGTPLGGSLPDVELEQDGTLRIEGTGGQLTFSSTAITIRGHRVGDP
jgi:hypothetical protein